MKCQLSVRSHCILVVAIFLVGAHTASTNVMEEAHSECLAPAAYGLQVATDSYSEPLTQPKQATPVFEEHGIPCSRHSLWTVIALPLVVAALVYVLNTLREPRRIQLRPPPSLIRYRHSLQQLYDWHGHLALATLAVVGAYRSDLFWPWSLIAFSLAVAWSYKEVIISCMDELGLSAPEIAAWDWIKGLPYLKLFFGEDSDLPELEEIPDLRVSGDKQYSSPTAPESDLRIQRKRSDLRRQADKIGQSPPLMHGRRMEGGWGWVSSRPGIPPPDWLVYDDMLGLLHYEVVAGWNRASPCRKQMKTGL